MNLKSRTAAASVALLLLLAPLSSARAGFAPLAPHAPAMLAAAASNDSLDFTLRNRTGYDIKAIFIGKAGNKEFHDRDEILHGRRQLVDGHDLPITFQPQQQYEVWDMRVIFEDDSSADFYELKLPEINKITLHYNRKMDKTTYEVE